MSAMLKPTGISSYTAMVVAMGKPAKWGEKTLLVRFVEQNGQSTVFVISGAALGAFETCEQWCIYDMQVPGKCLKRRDSRKRFGVHSSYEVVLKFPCPLKPSAIVWPLRLAYKFIEWNKMKHLSHAETFDMCGKVASVPVSDLTAMPPKSTVKLSCQGSVQDVQLYGAHKSTKLAVGDVVAVSGLGVRKWKRRKVVRTLLLTVVEVNPPQENLPVPRTRRHGWCRTKHRIRKRAKTGFQGYCKMCFKKKFPAAYAVKEARRSSTCVLCGSTAQLSKAGHCRPCRRARCCEGCGAMNAEPKAPSCVVCPTRRDLLRAKKHRLALWCLKCTGAAERCSAMCRDCYDRAHPKATVAS